MTENAKNKSIDIAMLTPSERIVDIRHPKTDEPIGVKVTLVSLDDERLKKMRNAIQRERDRLQLRGKFFTPEEQIDNAIKTMQVAITGWHWDDGVNFHGEVPDCSAKNIRDVVTELPWFGAQIAEALDDSKAFFQ